MPANTEKRKILINAGSNVLSFVATLVVTFFVLPILVHGLRDERYGIWLLVSSILAYMALGDLGIGAAVLRYVAKFGGLGDKENVNRIFSTSIFIFTGVGVLLLTVTLILSFGWSCPLGVAPHLASDARWLLMLLGANLAIGCPLGLYRTVLEALGHYPTVNAIRIIMLLVRYGLYVAIIFTDGGIPGIAVATMVCSLTQSMAYAAAAHRHLPSLRFSLRYVGWTTFRRIWGYSAYVFIHGVAGCVSSRTSPIIIGAFVSPAAITYFGIAAALNAQAGDVLRHMIAVLTPAVSRWDALDDYSSIRRLWLTGTRYLLFLAMPIQVGMLLLGRPFIALWMGPRYADLSYATLAILAIPFPLVLAHSMGNKILRGVGKVGTFSALMVAQALLSLVLSIALVGVFGIEGVALATAITLTLLCLSVIVLVCRVVGVSIAAFALHSWLKPTIGTSILGVIWLIGLQWIEPNTWARLVGLGLVGGAAYAVAICAFEKELRQAVLHMRTVYKQKLPFKTSGAETASESQSVEAT